VIVDEGQVEILISVMHLSFFSVSYVEYLWLFWNVCALFMYCNYFEKVLPKDIIC